MRPHVLVALTSLIGASAPRKRRPSKDSGCINIQSIDAEKVLASSPVGVDQPKV